MITVPSRFDAELFRQKYENVKDLTFYIDPDGFFQCPSIPELTSEDLLDCVGPDLPTINERLEAAELMIDLLLDTQGGA